MRPREKEREADFEPKKTREVSSIRDSGNPKNWCEPFESFSLL